MTRNERGDCGIIKQIITLNKAPMAKLRAMYEEVLGKPPTIRGRKALVRQIAAELQRRARDIDGEAKGDPMRKSARAKARKAAADEKPNRKRRPGEPRVGTILTRVWRGTEIRATIRENGIEIDGHLYRSLSEAAREITGARWSGPLFFQLRSRKRKEKTT